LTGNSVIPAPHIVMPFTRVIFFRVQMETVCATDDPVTSINTSVTGYYGLAGSLVTSQSTETNAQVAFKFFELHQHGKE